MRRGRAGGLEGETLVERGVTADDAQRRGFEHGDSRAGDGVIEAMPGSPGLSHGEHELAVGRGDGPLIGEGDPGERGHGNEEQDQCRVRSHGSLLEGRRFGSMRGDSRPRSSGRQAWGQLHLSEST